MGGFYKQLFCDFNESFSVIIDEDERVAYAYLYENEDIVGDVCLYNNAESPLTLNWNSMEGMPFLNPAHFIKENLSAIEFDKDVKLSWFSSGDDETVRFVEIYIRGRLIAKVSPGAFPGWSTVVIKDGPLAKVYPEIHG